MASLGPTVCFLASLSFFIIAESSQADVAAGDSDGFLGTLIGASLSDEFLGKVKTTAELETGQFLGAMEIPDGSQSDAILGTMKGLVDGYLGKYSSEVASFKDATAAMASVIANAGDTEAKVRAVDEKAKMTTAHQDTLKELASFIRTMDDTVKALRPGSSDDWKEQFPDLKAKVSKIYADYPSLLQAAALATTTATKKADPYVSEEFKLACPKEEFQRYQTILCSKTLGTCETDWCRDHKTQWKEKFAACTQFDCTFDPYGEPASDPPAADPERRAPPML